MIVWQSKGGKKENKNKNQVKRIYQSMICRICDVYTIYMGPLPTTKDQKMEQTLIMIKPDGVQRGLVGEIISRFEKKGFTLKGLKFSRVDRAFAEKHYADLSGKPFFSKLVDYITSGPVVAMVWEGKNVITTARKMIGATNPAESAPGTIRGDYAIIMGRNVIHGSDGVESGRKEIGLWFPGVVEWKSSLHSWIYEPEKRYVKKISGTWKNWHCVPGIDPLY